MSIGASARRGNGRRSASPRPAPVRRAAGAVVESLENRWLLSAGDLDATFGTGGLMTTGFTGSTVDTSTAVARDASGRIVVAGNQGGTNDVIVARYLPGGALDTSFGNGGKAVIDLGGADFAGAIAIDGSGIYLAGASGFNMALARLTSGGALDTSFDGDGVAIANLGVNSAADAIAIVSDGIYIGGTATFGTQHEFAVAKFDSAGNAAGSSTTGIGDQAQLTALLADGSDVVAGGYSTSGGTTSFTLHHYGASQWTAITDFGADSQIAALANHGGNILAIGSSNGSVALAQYSFGGVADTLFNPANPSSPSTYLDPTASGVITVRSGGVDGSGRLVVAGSELDAGPSRLAAVRYTFAGGPARDSGYGSGGIASSDLGDAANAHPLQAATVAADGSAVLAGVAFGPDQGSNFGGAILNGAGGVTATFNTDFTGPTTDMGAAAVTDSAGRTIVAGTRTQVLDDGILQHVVLTRYTTSGALDITFGIGGVAVVNFGTRDETFQSLALDASGNVLVAGLDQNGGIKVARFVNGTLDTSFASGGVLTVTDVLLVDNSAAVRVAADGNKVVVAGTTFTEAGSADFYVRRYNADGSPDMSFNGGNIVTADARVVAGGPAAFDNDIARAVLVLADGSIIVGGSSHNDDLGVEDFAVVRFDSSGNAVAAAFQAFGADGAINALAVQGSNILAAGDVFGLVAVARFDTANNTFDSSFGTDGVTLLDGLTTRGGAKAVAVDSHNAIGVVTTDDNTDELLIARLTDGGEIDTSFSDDGVANTGLISGENDIAGITTDAAGNLVAVGSKRVTPLNQDIAVERFDGGYAPVIVDPTVAINGAPASSPEGTAINLTSSVTPGSGTIASYAWSVTKNGNPYASGTAANFSFTPDDNASYVVTLTVTASDGGTGSAPAQTITVTNVAPTPAIQGAPASSLEGTSISVSATSTDPGTLDTTTYAWSVTKNGNPYASGTGVNFSFTPNDNASYVITLTATDNDLSAGTATATVSVTNVAPSATINGAPASSPAGTPINLTSTVTDPAGANDPITYAWSVTRNGVAYGTNGTGANYSFTPADAATYVVTLTVNDGDGGSDTKTATINVTPVAGVSATLSGGILTIAGDGAGNTVNVSLNGAGNYHVVIGTQVDQVFAFGSVNSILIQAGAGDDVITIANGVAIPAEVHGGDGNDVILAGGGDDMLFGEDGNDILTGNSGNDVIIGGTGNDILSGGNGRDILVGGLGSDIITGDNGDDILIAGATAYNTDPAGLSAIRNIWTGGGSYTTRVNALKANLLKPSNLFNDTSIDLLSGNNGQDWIIANVSGGGTLDQVLGIAGNEVVTDL